MKGVLKSVGAEVVVERSRAKIWESKGDGHLAFGVLVGKRGLYD